MLDSALAGADEAGAVVERIDVPSLDIHPCQACNACFKTGRCIQQDDMQALYPKLLEWEGVILAAPIFSMGLAAQAKILIDRLQCCWARKFVLKEHTVPEELRERRRGLWLSAAGMNRKDVFDPATRTVRYFFGMLEINKWEKVTYHGVDEEGAITAVPGALERCREAGARLVTGAVPVPGLDL
jgi:FMN-dependent NADH-azoreductase